jgi:predicted metal-dependent phosphoesterase TrpH
MALKLKVDLHIHTSNDLVEIVAGRKKLITPKEIIDTAVEQNFDAIAITHHGVQYYDKELINYANQKGLLLIPGIETFIQRKHVLLINFSAKKHILTYRDLAKYKTDEVLVIAPHPFYRFVTCVGNDLIHHRECFDAVEYCHFYYKIFNPNRKAIQVAQQLNLPVVGNSDAHRRFQFGKTYSYVYAEQKTIPAIIQAIKQGNVEYVSHPLTLGEFLKEMIWLLEKMPYIINIAFRKIALRTSQPFLIRKFATPKVKKSSHSIDHKRLEAPNIRKTLAKSHLKSMSGE